MTSHEASHHKKPSYSEQVSALDSLHVEQSELLKAAGIFDVIDAIGIEKVGEDFSTYPKEVMVFRDRSHDGEVADKPLVQHTGLLVRFMRPVQERDYTSRGRLMAPRGQTLRIIVSDFNLDEGQKLVENFGHTKHTERNVGSFVMQLGRTRSTNTSFSRHQISLIRELAHELEQHGEGLAYNHDLTEILRQTTEEP